nr:sulfite exporter TauE/SafE family protein [Candidatus Manganitrophus noduliformans]
MDRTMRLPFKVSTTTSNFMIGVTAAASAGIYFSRGYIDPGLSMPVMLGFSRAPCWERVNWSSRGRGTYGSCSPA